MRKYRATLPPLDMLVFFEAAHRVGSFTGCAAELHVSQAAVSKRIQQLEEWIGKPLFTRHGKRLTSTETGDNLYQTVGVALEFLRQGLGNLRESAERPLAVAANTSIGMFWLAPHLQAFGLSGDACPTSLTTSDNGNDLFGAKNDLVLAYSNGAVPGWMCTHLLDEVLTPMASPELAARLEADRSRPFRDLRAADRPPLLNYPRAAPDWVDWRVWFQSLAIGGSDSWRLKAVSTYSQSIGEAIRGKGIALGSIALLQAELSAGRLVPLSCDIVRTGRGYYLCHVEKSPLSDDARRLADFLVDAARKQNAEVQPG